MFHWITSTRGHPTFLGGNRGWIETISPMPTYGYICDKCGHEFETFQSMTADPLKVCPKALCGKTRWGKGKVKRSISAGAGLLFKGSGFYITDYRSEGYKQAAKNDSASASKPPAGTESKSASSDTKPAAKSESKPPKPSKPAAS